MPRGSCVPPRVSSRATIACTSISATCCRPAIRPTRPIREYRRAIAINPENADAHFNLALILGPRRQLDEAIAHLRRALAINPQNANVHRNLGIALGMQGRREQAIQELREALRIQPDLAEAQQNLDTLLNAK